MVPFPRRDTWDCQDGLPTQTDPPGTTPGRFSAVLFQSQAGRVWDFLEHLSHPRVQVDPVYPRAPVPRPRRLEEGPKSKLSEQAPIGSRDIGRRGRMKLILGSLAPVQGKIKPSCKHQIHFCPSNQIHL